MNNPFEIAGVTEKEYRVWCIENKKPHYDRAVKKQFFTKIFEGKLVRDKDGKLVKSTIKKENN